MSNVQESINYDLVIVGAGAAGLYAAAHLALSLSGLESKKRVLLVEQKKETGKKLLLTGSGQCNLTNSKNIRDFVPCYGENGSKIRSVLYAHNNIDTMSFFESQGLPLWVREDAKVFPETLNAKDVRGLLLRLCQSHGVEIWTQSKLIDVEPENQGFGVCLEMLAGGVSKKKSLCTRFLLLCCGGASYPATGSDGSVFSILKNLGVKQIPLKPALVPIVVDFYPYRNLAGVAIQQVRLKIGVGKRSKSVLGPLLFAHQFFSGPAILSLSRYVEKGDRFSVDYLPESSEEALFLEIQKEANGSQKQVDTFLSQCPSIQRGGLAKRLITVLCERLELKPTAKASSLSVKTIKALAKLLKADSFVVVGTKGWHLAMVSAGGVSLDEVDVKTMSSKKYPQLFFAGEMLDVDGDTGGYNLQFAFSSAKRAVEAIVSKI